MAVACDDAGGNARTISNDITGVSWAMPSGTQDVTGLDSSGMERLLLLADLTVTLTGAFNDASNLSFQVFKNYRTLAASQVGRTTAIAHSGQTLSDEVLYSDFSFDRGADGSLTWSAPGSLSDGGVPAWA